MTNLPLPTGHMVYPAPSVPEPVYEEINPINLEPAPVVETEVEFADPGPDVEKLPEAPGIAFFSLIGSDGVQLNVTARAWSSRLAVQEAIQTKNWMLKNGFSVASNQGHQSVSAPGGKKSVDPNGGYIVAKQMSFAPHLDKNHVPTGKVTVSFYAEENGKIHAFPDLTFVRQPKNAVAMLSTTGSPWTERHVTTPQKYDVDYIVTWKPGDINSTGNPYKNVEKVLPNKPENIPA